MIIVIFAYAHFRKKRWSNLLKKIEFSGQKKEIQNFIHRFGKEKSKHSWNVREYYFSFDRIRDFAKVLSRKGVRISEKTLRDLLRHYIDEEEYSLTEESVLKKPFSFDELSGSEFEFLLKRLFEAMNYKVKVIGKTGDQGGDLVLNKDGKRILIQAKRYTGSVGNAAVQQAFAAKSHYDCTDAAVVTTGEFTREARELAKTTQVELFDKMELQRLLSKHLKESWS